MTDEPTHLTGNDDEGGDDDGDGLVEIGEWPKIQAQVLRRRLETASVPVMIEWTGAADDRRGVLLVPEDQSEFAAAVVNEIDVDDEVSDDSPARLRRPHRRTPLRHRRPPRRAAHPPRRPRGRRQTLISGSRLPPAPR